MIVVDASAVLELLLQTSKAAAISGIALTEQERWHAPHLLDIEITQALRRLVQAKAIAAARAEQALSDLSQLVIERHEHLSLVARIWQLREAISAYDACYVALAEALDAPLLTCDGRLARAHGHAAQMRLV